MKKFQHKVTDLSIGGEEKYHEDFYFNCSSQENSLLNCWAVGHGCWKNNYCAELSRMRYISLEFVFDGDFTLLCDSGTYKLTRGTLVCFRNSERQMICRKYGRKWCVFIYGSIAEETVQKIFGNHDILYMSDPEKIENMYRKLSESAASGDEQINSYLFELLDQIYSSSCQQQYPPQLTRILEHWEQYPGWQESRSELAEIAGISISTLDRLFQKYFNLPVTDYRLEKRITMACRLLQLPGATIKETAEKCGFSSSAFFCRTFKKSKNCTPKEFIRNRNK